MDHIVEQRLSTKAHDIAKRLFELHGLKQAKCYIAAEMDRGSKARQSYWLQVWRELKEITRDQTP